MAKKKIISESSNPKKNKKDISVGVVGSGSFATAIVKMLVEKLQSSTLVRKK